MNKKSAYNFLYQSLYQLTLIILPIITIPIVSRALGPSGIGTWNYVNSIVNYFVLIGGLGLVNYGVREISLVRKDKFQLSKKFWELEFFNIFFSGITLIIFILFSFLVKYKMLFLTQSFTILSVLFDITWFFGGLEDFKKITFSNIFIKLISFVLIVLLIKKPQDIYMYFLIQSLSILASRGVLWFFLYDKIKFVKVKIKDVLQHLLPALNFFLAKVGSTIFSNLNKTILGLTATMHVVGIYSNSLTMVMMATSLVNSLNIVMIPRMSDLNKRDEKKMVSTLVETVHFQFYLTIAIMFGIIATNSKMITWFFGSEFNQMISVVPFQAISIVLQTFYGAVSSQYLIPKNQMKSYNLSILIGALVSFFIDILLIPKIGIFGAVAGNLLGQFTVASIRAILLIKRTTFKFKIVEILKYIISGILMWGIIYIFTNQMSASPLVTLLQVIIGVATYVLISIILKTEVAINAIKLVKRRGYINE